MPIEVSKVLVGAPDQKTTGAILDAPVGTPLPKSAVETLSTAFSSSGYVSKDGVKLSTDRSTSELEDWSKSSVRKVLGGFDATITWAEMQMSYEALVHAFGQHSVKRTAATKDHGEQITLEISEELPEPRSWVFNMKDGKNRMRIVVPRGQVSKVDALSFAPDNAIELPITLTCYRDGDKKRIYIHFDNGEVISA